MSNSRSDEAKKVSRRNLLKGLGATLVVGAIVLIGAEEMNILPLPKRTPSTATTSTPATTPSQTASSAQSVTPTTTSSATTTTPPPTTTTKTPSTTSSKTSFDVTLIAVPAYPYSGDPVMFTATPIGGTPPYTISIDCGDGATLTANGPHTYMQAGIYNALATVTDSKGAEASATYLVTVEPPPAV